MKKLLIVGAGSVGKFIAYNMNDFTTSFELIGFLDDDPQKEKQIVAGYNVLGNLQTISEYAGNGFALVFGIAFPAAKKNILQRYADLAFDFPAMISKRAWISPNVTLGRGCIIYPGVSINYESQIGDFVVMNMNCAIGHNCVVGAHTSLAPGVNLGGFTQIGSNSDIGIGAVTIQHIQIGANCIIGGQSMIIHDVPDNSKIAGVPARSIDKT